MHSMTLFFLASSADCRSTSAARFFSSSVGPVPEKTASGEWNGPHRFSPPRIAVISMAHLCRSSAAWRTLASGLIGLASGPTHRDGRAAQALVLQLPGDRLVVGRVAFEERDLDAVEAGLLELGEDREVLAR